MNNKLFKLSIIIVTYNSQNEIEKCLNAIQNSKIENYEIIIVDNASNDNTIKLIKQKYSSIFIIENNRNIGFGSANNIGIKKASSEYICLLNPDAYLYPDTLSELVAFMAKNPYIGIIGPKLLYEDSRLQPSSKHFPRIITEFCNYSIIGNYLLEYIKRIRSKRKYSNLNTKNSVTNIDEGYKTDWLTGACIVIKKEALKKIGLFDENYFIYCEETDLFYRLAKETNFITWFFPKVSCIHVGSHSTSKKWIETEIKGLESKFYFFRKHYGYICETILKSLIFMEYFVQLILFPIFYLLIPNKIQDLKLRNKILYKWIVKDY